MPRPATIGNDGPGLATTRPGGPVMANTILVKTVMCRSGV